jgi:aminoglycoside 6-adenylyltransferase
MKVRNEKEMYDLILGFAKEDERIRAVVLNGSRADLSVKKDCFQDYDIQFIVTEVKSFVSDSSWINVFGERMIMQLPEDWHNHLYDYNSNKSFIYLMQFVDGTRIDLRLSTMEDFKDKGEPTITLIDKDGILPLFPESKGECYFVKEPTEKEFHDCCNEFWWLCPYVAKELWREGLPYAKLLFEGHIRAELMKILDWFVGLQYDYKVNTGKMGKYLKLFLSNEDWAVFKKTYPNLCEENIWTSLFFMCDMFREKAEIVADFFGYAYPINDDKSVTAYLKHVRLLPKYAKAIY